MSSAGAPQPPKSRLRHRFPRSLRQNWKLAAAFGVFVTVMATVFGTAPIRPLITGDASVISSPITENIAGTVDLFDATTEHEITVEINAAEYQDMIETYQKEGEKDWVSAEVTIDGTLLTDVAARLKGNSTLMSLRGIEHRPGGAQQLGGAQQPGGEQRPGADHATGGAHAPAGGDQAGQGMGPGNMVILSADDPASLPLLLSFNEYVEGRAYQGMTELSIRPGSPVLNEAVALEITAESGQPTQRYGYAVYSVNGSASQTRLILEHPDEGYADSLTEGDGVLYKVTADADFSYQGDDQTTYAEQFTQVNGQGSVDLQPIISFLKWLDEADDATFAAELGNRVDTASLARYTATQNLLVNFDDISGPGRNGFLWYDLETQKFSIISWDLNLVLQSDSTAGPHDEIIISFGGGNAQIPPEMPSGASGIKIGNTLIDRYLVSSAFTAQYEDAYRQLYDEFFANGRAVEIAEEVAATVPTSDGLTEETLKTRTDELAERLQRRAEALAANPVIDRS
ncbi:CotH kinase family protein [Nocardia amikacinitolerans]|uniref:CotH kinase family protein n=1 Tax=Nocardia amikacinitolerans TaxID=756689 RepID=UPI0020A404F7|nr:CotH kinase family protein [Nocardia amikacinitolerans]MCP2280969.1 Spore coat protein CotH [Nocardia amikacinitolerans]MCP2297981.1 Spore coat protein CotH [Nocardia amikacinitolerans]